MHFTLTILTLLYVIFLIVPGILFQKVYFSEYYKKQYSFGVFADRLVVSVFLGLAIQSLSAYINLLRHNYFNNTDFTVKSVYKKIRFSHKGLAENTLPNVSDNDIQIFIFQIAISLFVTIALGYIFRLLVIWSRLDLRNSFFKVKDDWSYIFTDKKRRFDLSNQLGKRRFLGTKLNVLTRENKNKIYLYSGYYYDHTFKADGELESVMIKGASKHYEYDHKTSEKGKIDAIPGSLFIIPYSDILNVNIEYEYETKTGNNSFLNFFFNLVLIVPIIFPAYPWITEASIFRKIIAMVIFLFSYFFYAGLISVIKDYFMPKDKNSKSVSKENEKNGLTSKVITMILFISIWVIITYYGFSLLKT